MIKEEMCSWRKKMMGEKEKGRKSRSRGNFCGLKLANL